MEKRLYRSKKERMIAGVCGGIGEYSKVDPTIIRLLWVIFSFPLGIIGGVILYIIAAIVIPEASESDTGSANIEGS